MGHTSSGLGGVIVVILKATVVEGRARLVVGGSVVAKGCCDDSVVGGEIVVGLGGPYMDSNI